MGWPVSMYTLLRILSLHLFKTNESLSPAHYVELSDWKPVIKRNYIIFPMKIFSQIHPICVFTTTISSPVPSQQIKHRHLNLAFKSVHIMIITNNLNIYIPFFLLMHPHCNQTGQLMALQESSLHTLLNSFRCGSIKHLLSLSRAWGAMPIPYHWE